MATPNDLYQAIALVVGGNIKQRREDLGMNQTELGGLVFLAQQTISHYESGRTVPDAVTLWMIAQALGCKIEELWK